MSVVVALSWATILGRVSVYCSNINESSAVRFSVYISYQSVSIPRSSQYQGLS